MGLRPRNPSYVEELTERLRQNLANGAALDDVVLALADACARRAVDSSPAVNVERASQVAVYTSAAQSLEQTARDLRSIEKRVRQEAWKRFKITE